MRVQNHHCGPERARTVLNVRDLYALEKPPFFDPPGKGDQKAAEREGKSTLDRSCAASTTRRSAPGQQALLGRRDGSPRPGTASSPQHGRWDKTTLARAKHLDYTMRTAIYEGHLDRGCSAYGACERNVVVLSVRNRAVGQCLKRQGCRFGGDFQGVASDVSQYNIWDAYLTQISGPDRLLPAHRPGQQGLLRPHPGHVRQNVGDAERILYGSDADLRDMFPRQFHVRPDRAAPLLSPAGHGQVLPAADRIEYMSGAVAENGPTTR
jgi:hypothetical protein